MGVCFMLLMSGLLMVDRYELGTAVAFEPVPEDAEEFLRSPADVAFDEKGRVYLLDIGATSVFVWNEDGSYVGRVGRRGQGPGEFSFRANFGGSQGFISVAGEQIYVYDGGNKNVLVFGLDLAYVRSFPLQIANGRMDRFRVMTDGNLFIFHSSFFADEPYRRVAIYSQAGEERATVRQVADTTWYYTSENGQQRVTLIPYSTTLFAEYLPAVNQIVMGDTGTDRFNLLAADGSPLREVPFKVARREVTEADEADYREQEWFKNQQFFKVEFPEMRPYYNQLIHLGGRGYLMYVQTVNGRRCDGFWLNREGAVKGRFHRDMGQRGGLYGVGEKIVGVSTDEDGEFSVGFLDPVLKSGT